MTMHISAVLAILLMSSVVSAQQLAFPTAEGFGRFATGGRQGFVCHVNTLSSGTTGAQIDIGPHHSGTFRYCLGLSGTRTIIFDVGGTINIGGVQVNVANGNFTIAGQTAPGGGILVRGMRLVLLGPDDVIIRFYRSRSGITGVPVTDYSWTNLTVSTGSDDIIIDHCSLSWSPDDVSGIYQATDVTFQNCIIAEGLSGISTFNTSTQQTESSRGKAMWIGSTNQDRASILRNLFMSFDDRIPLIKGTGVQLVNNIFYNVRQYSILWIGQYGTSGIYSYIENYFEPGPNSNATDDMMIHTLGYPSDGVSLTEHNNSQLYVSGNRHTVRRTDDNMSENALVREASGTNALPLVGTNPTMFPAVSQTTWELARPGIITNGGASIPSRDAVDTRLINELQTGGGVTGGGVSGNPQTLGMYPTITTGSRVEGYDTDSDGIPDAWETACSSAVNAATTNGGLSISDGADGAELVTTTGYSKLEHYLNEVAGDYAPGTCGGLATGDTTAPTGVAITAPSASATVSGSNVTYSATASDETAIDRVEFYQNDALIASDSSSPYSITWDTTLLPDGDKTLYVKAYDTSQNSMQSASVNVVVDNLSGYIAVHTGSTPTIDGNLSEFSAANPVTLNGTGGLTPLNATDLRLMWDSTALYIGAITTDSQLTAAVSTHDKATAPLIHNDDTIEIVIDTDNDGVWEATDYKFMVNAQNATWDARNLTDLTYEPTYSTAVVLVTDLNDGADDASWTVEIAIPWAQIGGISPSAGNVYGINVQMDDMDTSRTSYAWNGSVNALADAQDVELGPSGGGDTTDPTNVAITDPVNGQYVRGTYSIRATAQDDVGIDSVEFYEATTLLCTDTTPSQGAFTCDWDTTQETEGNYNLKVTACDTAVTPNCVDSSTIGVVVDNTAPSNPSNLTLVTDADEGDSTIFLDWTASTDVSGSITYSIERCEGVGCSSFTQVDTSSIDNYNDQFLSELTTYCYKVRAYDAALNPSAGYSNTECISTLDIAFVPPEPTSLLTTALNMVNTPSVPTGLSTSASGTLSAPLVPTGLSTSAVSSLTFPAVPTGVISP